MELPTIPTRSTWLPRREALSERPKRAIDRSSPSGLASLRDESATGGLRELREALLAPPPTAMTTTAMPPANPAAAPARRRAAPARTRRRRSPLRSREECRSSPARGRPPGGSGRSPPPGLPARSWTPARSGSPTGSRWWSPPLSLRQEVRRLAGLAEIVGNRHRFRGLNETNPDGADRSGGNGILGKAKEGSTGGSVHHLFLLCFC